MGVQSGQPLSLYAIFHLNIAYSSIEEARRPELIRQCYWPLLRLIAEHRVPLGIEASGYTLETIAAIDPAWLVELRRLIHDQRCELIGSGYAQLIGPLVPAEVNRANQRLGIQAYQRLLGVRPETALVNEQAYSAGLLEHYISAGYRAIVMEWENPARQHPEWHAEWRYSPQIARGQHGEQIALLWNSSIAFQKFQRYAHGEIDLDEYMAYLVGQVGTSPRAFPMYGNDAEIFGFRPNRLHTEPALDHDTEWARIRRLMEVLRQDCRFRLVRPSEVLRDMGDSRAMHPLALEAAAAPVPVKKQNKYNVTRWAVTGRDSLGINTRCWRLSEKLGNVTGAGDEDWRELCYLWSSDFRTHITALRWQDYCVRLAAFECRTFDCPPTPERSASEGAGSVPSLARRASVRSTREQSILRAHFPETINPTRGLVGRTTRSATIRYERHCLVIRTECVQLSLNTRRGLAIERLVFDQACGNRPLCGTLPHGSFDDISLAADFYSGHLVFETPGRHKITDLSPVEPRIENDAEGRGVVVHADSATPLGMVAKRIHIFGDCSRVELTYGLEWQAAPVGSLRLGYITLIPSSFRRDQLFFRAHQGGTDPDTFSIRPTVSFDHGAAVSSLVTASQALALTGRVVEFGDACGGVRIECDQSLATLVAMVQYTPVADSMFLCRLCFSAAEVDDTCKDDVQPRMLDRLQVRIGLSPLGATTLPERRGAPETVLAGLDCDHRGRQELRNAL